MSFWRLCLPGTVYESSDSKVAGDGILDEAAAPLPEGEARRWGCCKAKPSEYIVACWGLLDYVYEFWIVCLHAVLMATMVQSKAVLER